MSLLSLSEDAVSANQNALNNVINDVPLIYSTLLFAIFGPYLEEVIFRHILIGKLSKLTKINIVLLALASFVLFDLIHVVKPIDFIGYLPLSLIFTVSYFIGKKHTAYILTLH